MPRASGLERAPLHHSPQPNPLHARGPTERYDEASRKNAPLLRVDFWLLFARGLGSTLLSNCLAVGLPLDGDKGYR